MNLYSHEELVYDIDSRKEEKLMKKGIGKAVSVLVGGVAGAVAGGLAIGNKMGKKMEEKEDFFQKILSYYFIYNQWLSMHQQGKNLVEYFKKNGYKTIAIYGMKELGERLYDELKDSSITVKYIIDKKADTIYADVDVDVVTLDDDLEPVDVIVVTASYFFDEIDRDLGTKVDYPVVSLEDIIYEV